MGALLTKKVLLCWARWSIFAVTIQFVLIGIVDGDFLKIFTSSKSLDLNSAPFLLRDSPLLKLFSKVGVKTYKEVFELFFFPLFFLPLFIIFFRRPFSLLGLVGYLIVTGWLMLGGVLVFILTTCCVAITFIVTDCEPEGF